VVWFLTPSLFCSPLNAIASPSPLFSGSTKPNQYGGRAGRLLAMYFPRTSHHCPTRFPLFCIKSGFVVNFIFLYTVPVCLLGAEFKSHHVVHDSLSNWDSSTSLLNPWPANVRRMASMHDDSGAPGRVRPLCQTSTNDDPTVNGKCLILLSFLLFLFLHFQNCFFLILNPISFHWGDGPLG
jgi:hypothetical protein